MDTASKTNRRSVMRGFSSSPDEAVAVRELAEQIKQPEMSAVIFFASSKYDLEKLGDELKQTFAVPVVGCTTSGEITPQGYREHSITGVSLADAQLEVLIHEIRPLSCLDVSRIEDIATSVKGRLSAAKREDPATAAFGLLLIDGLSTMEEQVIAQLNHHLLSVPLIGGSAGDDLAFHKTYVYVNGRFVSDCATVAVFITTLPFKTFKMQHFVPTDKKLVITRADPNQRIVYEINAKPAATEYANLLGLNIDDLQPMVFTKYPVMLKIGGEYYVRSIQKVNADGSLTFFCAIDEGLVLTLSEGIDLVNNLEDTLGRAADSVPNPQLIIGCECILRRLEVIEKNLTETVGTIMARNHVVGFHTYGEQFDSVHVNQTFTGVVVGVR